MDIQFPDASALAQDPASGVVHLHAQATGGVTSEEALSIVLGAGDETTTIDVPAVQVTKRGPIPTVIKSATGADGAAWAVAGDGLSAAPPAS